MSSTPLKLDVPEEPYYYERPRDWQPKKIPYKGPLRLIRLCVLGAFLPAALVAGPIYIRYRIYSEQLYPLAASDMRLIDKKVSTFWCQRQVVKVNATFNAYLLKKAPEIEGKLVPVSMTRHLVLEDDMKEYWGFYLLRGSSATVSTCVRWPGASLTIIRGHKHLHECAFIGDDSSEELEELVQIAQERGLLNGTGADFHLRLSKDSGPSNVPEKMKRARQDVRFHEKSNAPRHPNETLPSSGSTSFNYGSHELDTNAMRTILTSLFGKTLDTKKKLKENVHHHYEGTFKDFANIDKPSIVRSSSLPSSNDNFWKSKNDEKKLEKKNFDDPSRAKIVKKIVSYASKNFDESSNSKSSRKTKISTTKKLIEKLSDDSLMRLTNASSTSSEVFDEVLKKLNSLGERGERVLKKLVRVIDRRDSNFTRGESARVDKMADRGSSMEDAKRGRRQVEVGSSLRNSLTEDVDQTEDAALEEEDLYPDGIAEDRGTVNETTLNDRSNSEFWSSFSSSEERLLECEGLILNLPLTPHLQCSRNFENEHVKASAANTVTYRVPTDGYYFFVFNSENEIQPNYVRIRFDLMKNVYDTSDPVHVCKNSTEPCALPFNFFSYEKTVLELPVNGNDSQWNEEYVVVSTCEPRTSIYMICIIAVPLLVLIFAFH